MTQSLPPRPSLEHLKNQAKALLRSAQKNEPAALARLSAHLPHLQPGVPQESPLSGQAKRRLTLADVQFALARELGFTHWAALKHHVELAEMEAQSVNDRVAALLASCLHGELDRAERLLQRFPDLPARDIYAALVVGEASVVLKMLDAQPSLLHESGGPLKAAPLVYACHSHFAKPSSAREPALRGLIQELLRKGADANAFWRTPQFHYTPLSALYGACGVNGNAAIAKMLLDAGALTDDNESLYHSVEHDNTECTELLLRHGAKIEGTNALHNALGVGNVGALRLLLQYGADVNMRIPQQQGMTLLQWAIECNSGREVLELLIERGADLQAKSWDGLSPFRRAVRCGHADALELLTQHNVAESLTPKEAFLGACMAGQEEQALESLRAAPELMSQLTAADKYLLNAAAWRGNEKGVRAFLAAGFHVAWGNEHQATALHAAAWKGHREIVNILLPHHPPLDVKDTEFHCTPLEWALHGSCNCNWRHCDAQERDEIYAAIVRALVDAGSPPPVERIVQPCRGKVEEVLAEAGFIHQTELT